jgi:hypothetical protein
MIAETLAMYAKATARTFEGRENTVGASEIGQCGRKVFFAKNAGDCVYGAACDKDFSDSWGAILRGRLIEEHFWTLALRARFGDKLLYAGDEQKTFVFEFLSATPDGLLIEQPSDALAALGINDIGGDGSLIVEGKTIDPRARLDDLKPEHDFQAQVQIGLIRELTPYRPEVALLSYVNASFLDDVVEFVVRFDPTIFENAKHRAALILTARAADELKPEGWIAGGRECEFCPYTGACGVIRHAVPTRATSEPVDPQFIAEICELALAAKEHRTAAEAATAAQREVEHEIKERLRAKGVRHVVGNGVSVTWSAVTGRPSFDEKGILEAATKVGVDLSRFETTGDTSSRLDVRVNKKRLA